MNETGYMVSYLGVDKDGKLLTSQNTVNLTRGQAASG